MIWVFAAVVVLAIAWAIRVLQVSNRAAHRPPISPDVTNRVTFGPWATHGPHCRCNVCR